MILDVGFRITIESNYIVYVDDSIITAIFNLPTSGPPDLSTHKISIQLDLNYTVFLGTRAGLRLSSKFNFIEHIQ